MPKIFLVDDKDEDDRELLEEEILTIEKGAIIQAATSGAEALAYLSNFTNNELPFIIADYNMPDLTGAEVLEIIK